MTNLFNDYEKHWAELCVDESKRCSPEYWNSRAEDYADFIVNSDFDHGRKILELFKKEGDSHEKTHYNLQRSIWRFIAGRFMQDNA